MTQRKKSSAFDHHMRPAEPDPSTGARQLIPVFGDQLDGPSALVEDADPERGVFLLVEVREESTHVVSHKQRTAVFLFAMRHFAADLAANGFSVRYTRLDDPDNTHSFRGEIRRAIDELQPEAIRAMRPGEHRVMQVLNDTRESFEDDLQVIEDPHFYSTPDYFAEWAERRKEITPEYFYRQVRKDFDILLAGGGGKRPAGGQWNDDEQNRDPSTAAPVICPDRGASSRMHSRGRSSVSSRAKSPTIRYRLAGFGPYQDAMFEGAPWMYHSLLSVALNLHILDPRDCVKAAIRAYEDGKAPSNSVEGFVRQVVGWRRFIRGVYGYAGPDYADRNGLHEDGALPDFYWSGETDMNCMKQCIGEVLENGYGHHIQRLMVTGNFALIAGVHPRPVSDWYLGMYVDAIDWVTLPNALGMVMHADAGLVGTKPYASTGRYIERMSNYCDNCRYDPKQRLGKDACPFSTFYWDFLIRHEERFGSNRRMGLVLKNLERVDPGEKREIRGPADALRKRLGISNRAESPD